MYRAIGVVGLLVMVGLIGWAMIPQHRAPIRSKTDRPTPTPTATPTTKPTPAPETERSETIDLSRTFEPISDENRVPSLSELLPVVHREELPPPTVVESSWLGRMFGGSTSSKSQPEEVKVLEITGNELIPEFLKGNKVAPTPKVVPPQ